MPYVICGACELVTYSAALWASTDECPRCGTSLPSARRSELLAVAMQDELSHWLSNPDSAPERPRGGEHA
jgi:hypothetical protein